MLASGFARFVQHNVHYIQHDDGVAERPSRLQILVWLLILIAALAVYLSQYEGVQIGYYGDDTYYVLLGRSLVFSNGYGLYHFPGSEPSTPFPFGFPLLLTPLIRLFPTNPGILKIESLIAILLSTSLLFWAWPLLSRVKSYWWGLAVGAQFALSPGMVTYSRAVVSEPAFIMWVLIALVLVEQCVRREKVSWLRAVLLGIATVMAVFTRTIGIALVLAVLARLVFLQPRRRIIRNLIGVSVGAMGFLGFVQVLTPVRVPDLIPNRYVSSYDTNVEQFIGTQTTAIGSEEHPGFAARTLQTILLYTQTPIRQTMLPVGGGETEAAFGQRFGIPDLPVLSNAIICGLIVIGMLAFLVYKGLSPGVLMYVVLYCGVLAVWPWALIRLLYPITPFLFFAFLWGIRLLLGQIQRFPAASSSGPRIADVVTALLAVMFIGATARVAAAPFDSRQYFYDFEVGSDWLKEHTAPESLVMGHQPQTIYFYAERKAMDLVPVTTEADLKTAIRENDIDYLMVTPCFTTVEGKTLCDGYVNDILLPLTDQMIADDSLKLVYNLQGRQEVSIFEVVDDSP